jgi:hypothetical protein
VKLEDDSFGERALNDGFDPFSIAAEKFFYRDCGWRDQ